MSLNCSLPSSPVWHGLLSALPALVGALLGAGAAIFAQHLLAKRQETMQNQRIAADKELKQMEFDRLDAGVRRQLVALVGQVCTYVAVVRETGHTDYEALRQMLDRLNDRIYRWEVPTAIEDHVAETLYGASEMLEIEYRTAIANGFDKFDDGITQTERAQREYFAKANFKVGCKQLCAFWATQGDMVRQSQFQLLMMDEEERKKHVALAREATKRKP